MSQIEEVTVWVSNRVLDEFELAGIGDHRDPAVEPAAAAAWKVRALAREGSVAMTVAEAEAFVATCELSARIAADAGDRRLWTVMRAAAVRTRRVLADARYQSTGALDEIAVNGRLVVKAVPR